MFYCETCAERNGWPQSLIMSYGAREETRGAFTYAGRMLQSWAQRVGTVSTETVTGLHDDPDQRPAILRPER